jgi:hypothetical protein
MPIVLTGVVILTDCGASLAMLPETNMKVALDDIGGEGEIVLIGIEDHLR